MRLCVQTPVLQKKKKKKSKQERKRRKKNSHRKKLVSILYSDTEVNVRWTMDLKIKGKAFHLMKCLS
jgi:hypothetical protein